jgi:RNA ligase
MKLKDYLDVDLLRKMIDLGYVNVTKHDFVDLYILNYSKMCTIDQMWNDVTEKCRGLIVDAVGNIRALPFKKFYNYEEIQDKSLIPNLPFKAYEKMDGSLGISYWIGNTMFLATRGSFKSNQAMMGTAILHSKGWDVLNQLDKNLTYLFEIITQEDPKVVNYGKLDEIFLLAVIDTNTGKELNIEDFRGLFEPVREYKDIANWETLRDDIDGTNREGFVIKFENGFRVKLKYDEYFDLFEIVYGLNDNAIFKMLYNDQLDDLLALVSRVQNSHKERIQERINYYVGWFNHIRLQCFNDFRNDFADRKEAAEYFKTCEYPSVLFAMLNGEDVTRYIWKIIAKSRKNDRQIDTSGVISI